jgi:hypothetical protein
MLKVLTASRKQQVGKAQAGDSIHSFSFDSLSWSTPAVKLPSKAGYIACFIKDSSEVYFVLSNKLYSLDQDYQITQVCILSANIESKYGPSHYSRGSIYSTNYHGLPFKLEVGVLW